MFRWTQSVFPSWLPTTNRTAISGPARRPARRHLTIESLEPRLLLSAAPTGSVATFTATHIVGWAYDTADGALPETIVINLNGAETTALANLARTDLARSLGSIYHGFDLTLPALAPGANTVKIYAQDQAGDRTLLRQASFTNRPPFGCVDAVNSAAVSGWAFDPDAAANPVQIRVDVNGVAGAWTTANLPRPDLVRGLGSANHGFSIAGNFTGQTVNVWIADAPSHQPVLLWTNNKAPLGCVNVLTLDSVSGWAFDAGVGAASIQVRVDIDNTPGTPVTANILRPDLVAGLGSAAHGFSIPLTNISPGTHTVQVWALDGDTTSGAPKLLRQASITNLPPTGAVTSVSLSAVTGWAWDPDGPNNGVSPILVSVYVDNTLWQTVSANLASAAVTGVRGANHGFSVDLTGLSTASHEIVVTAHDSRASAHDQIVLYDNFLNNHEPIGWLDTANAAAVSGWAYDADSANNGADPINVDLYVDGAYVRTASANLARPDLGSFLPSTNHGFTIALPALSWGAHQVQVFAAESQGTLSTEIGTATVTYVKPLGWVDTATAAQISGWAGSASLPAAAVSVDIYVDGALAATAAANTARPDLASLFAGNANHGFTVSLTGLSLAPGGHEVAVFMVDPGNGLLVPIKVQTITV